MVLYKVALYNKLRDSLARDMQRFDSRNFLANSDSSQSLEDGWRPNDEKSQGLSRASHFSNDKFKSRLLSQGGHRHSNGNDNNRSRGGLDKSSRENFHDGDREHNPHVHTTMNRSNSYAFLIMMMDGIGLSIISGCTLLQAHSEWVKLHRHHYQYNIISLSFLVCGRICQVIGLLLLIGYAFTMEKFPDLEKCGMAMLTVGPALAAIASGMFDSGGLDPHALLNKRMVMTELVELVGILFLDLAFVDAENIVVFLIEVAGFLTLMASAMFEFDFSPLVTQDTNGFLSNSVLSSYDAVVATFKATTIKIELIRISDCFGLALLMIVSYCQYRERAWEKSREKLKSEEGKDSLV